MVSRSVQALLDQLREQEPRGNTLYWIGPPGGKCDAGPGTDFAAGDEGSVSITPRQVG